MRVFVSQPMHGRDSKQIMMEFERIVNTIGADKFPKATFVTTYHTKEKPDDNVKRDRVWYLGRAIQILSTCDAIIFSKNYDLALGCSCEKWVAEVYGIPIYYEPQD